MLACDASSFGFNLIEGDLLSGCAFLLFLLLGAMMS